MPLHASGVDLAHPRRLEWAPSAGLDEGGRRMGMWDAVRREHVLEAIQEYDVLGQPAFLARHGFGAARAYQLIVAGRSYDSKAILGAAYRLATGQRISSHDFNGGVGSNGAATVLRRLGFEVKQTQSTALTRTNPRGGAPQENASHVATQSEPDAVLVGCVKTKRTSAAPARDLYVSPLFAKRRAYAE